MFELGRHRVGDRTVVVTVTERDDGDVHPLRVPADELEIRQRRLTTTPWTMLDQVHGVGVVAAPRRGSWAPVVGRGDVLIAQEPRRPLAVWAADCAPIVLVGPGAIAVVHAGWRGLAAGVVAVAVAAVRAHGAGELHAVVGPCVRGCCYEFGAEQRVAVAAGVGVAPESLATTTLAGRPGLDLPTVVAAACERHLVSVDLDGSCTGCDTRFFSHRVRAEAERHAVIARMEDAA